MRSLPNRKPLGLACIAMLMFVQIAFASEPIHLRIIWTENPQSEATISWSTTQRTSGNKVFYDVEARGVDTAKYAKNQAAQQNGQFSASKPSLFFHHARLTGLKPSTVYHLVVQSDGKTSRAIHFKTAPSTDEAFSILYGGDSRAEYEAGPKVDRMIAKMVDAHPKVIAFAHGGDYVSSGMRLDHWDNWLRHHELTISAKGRMLPIIPARGNHESSGPLYDEVFGTPGGGLGKNYFITKLSPKVLLLTLNSETSVEGDQKQFLEQALKASGGMRWRVVQYHRPAYPAVKSPGRTKRWVPLFEKYGVQLVCEGDGHCIKRTPPIRNDKIDPTGVVYVGEGGLGVNQRKPKTDRWYLKAPGVAGRGHHVMLLSFTTKTLSIDTYLLDGKLFDQYVIKAK